MMSATIPQRRPARHAVRLLPAARALVVLLSSCGAATQTAPTESELIVMVYNVENLFDVDGRALFPDYGPEHYGPRHLRTKLSNLVRVVRAVGAGRGPDIILFQELEADQTPADSPLDAAAFLQQYRQTTLSAMLSEPVAAPVRDLPAEALLLKALHDAGLGPYELRVGRFRTDPTGRKIAHVNATFSRLPILEARTHASPGARGTLEVVHDAGGHRLITFNAHWKSGASGAPAERIRIGNARVLRDRLHQLLAADPHADIIVGGDLNSHYDQAVRHAAFGELALYHVLGSRGDELGLQQPGGPDLYNLWYELPPQQRGSDVYQGEWGTLMHLLLTRGLYDCRGVQYVDNSFRVAILDDINAQPGSRVPWRWTFDAADGQGVSDHFPLYARFRVVEDQDPNRYLPLVNPGRPDPAPPAPRRVDYGAVQRTQVPAVRELGSDAAIRQARRIGQVYLVEGTVSGERPFRLRVFAEDYLVWAFDLDLRRQIYRRYQVGDRFTILGELGQHRGQWQFIVRDRAWLDP